jgi:hypothetical protein
VFVEDLAFACELVDRTARVVPVLCEPGHRSQRAPFAAAPDDDGRMWALHRLGLTTRLLQPVVLTLEVGRGVREQADDHLAGLVEHVEPLLERRQFDAVGVTLLLVPPGADPELEAAVGDDVECGRHVGQHRRVAVHVARHQHADAQTRRGLRQRGQRHPALEARTGGVGEDRIEVVEGPAGLVELDVVRGPPHGEHVCPGRVLGGGLEGEAHI